MPEGCCSLCGQPLEFRASSGLERRRHPHGRWMCPRELERWHLRLEALARAVDVTGDPRASAEFDDILVQHMRPAPQVTLEPTLEPA
jgi:hypothetical protein